ncbi:hypothetical protein NEMBOFW57_008083 [Staphylotrichum longicolle]|uniref:Heterokaryon incompatibility domain-containing protein n=1 Tax=Staphylotrichum longicolle TaxID=669026 RepID=A0AAD4ER41_9PEZI|nr:hypothetical protein NEMBOFW57_008083 [Staphylotrichum longicolle]
MSAASSCGPVYEPLRGGVEEIRLFTFELEEADVPDGDRIRCNLENVEIKNAPEYIALSYAWGDPTDTVEIELGGRPFRVTTSLVRALRRIRRWKSLWRFWADAICIDQSSVSEKNHQIPLMSKIYSQARGVVMWLGEEGDDSQLAMDLIRRWGKGVSTAMETDRDACYHNALRACLPLIDNPFDEKSLEALGCLLKRDYWRRVWIIQEVVLAKSRMMLCGDAMVDHQKFYLAYTIWSGIQHLNTDKTVNDGLATSFTRYLGSPSVGALVRLVYQRSARRRAGQLLGEDMFSLIESSWNSLSSDPRDRIYGLFGLLEENRPLPIPIDYGIAPDKIHLAFTTGLIQTSGRLDAISLSRFGFEDPSSPPRLPSWVPDFLAGPEAHTHVAFMDAGYQASGDSAAEFSLCAPGLLACKVVMCGEIAAVCDSGSNNLLGDPAQNWVWSWLATAKAHCKTDDMHPTGVPWRQAFFRTLVADYSMAKPGKAQFGNPEAEISFYGRAEGFMTFMRSYALERAKPFLESGIEMPPEPFSISLTADASSLFNLDTLRDEHALGDEVCGWMCNSSTTKDETIRKHLLAMFCGDPGSGAPYAIEWPYDEYACQADTMHLHNLLVAIRVTTGGRSFAVTQDGYMGLVPRFARKGDVICVPLGCRVPIVVRKDGPTHIVVGDSYVFGLMRGEMLAEVDAGKRQVTELILQ